MQEHTITYTIVYTLNPPNLENLGFFFKNKPKNRVFGGYAQYDSEA